MACPCGCAITFQHLLSSNYGHFRVDRPYGRSGSFLSQHRAQRRNRRHEEIACGGQHDELLRHFKGRPPVPGRVEATAFGLALVAYFYLRSKALEWPSNVAPPPLLWGTLIRLMQPPRRDCGSKIRYRPRAAAPLRSEVPSRARRGPKPARDRVF